MSWAAGAAAAVTAIAGGAEIVRRLVRWWKTNRHPPHPDATRTVAEFNSRIRTEFMERVRAQRILNGLERSLRHVPEIDLQVHNAPDLLKPSYARSTTDPTGLISPEEAYRQAGGQLLILGEAGSGKTTLALKLMRSLLETCLDDEAAPVPEIFPLASWAKDGKPLGEWLADLCQLRHGWAAPKWQTVLDEGLIAPFLDGLDEVDAHRRNACLQQINRFWEAGRGPVVLCSRLGEYKELTERVKLGGAITISLPEPKVIADGLVSLGPKWDDLRASLQDDLGPDGLKKMLSTPLMLKVAMLGYGTLDPTELSADSARPRARERVWAHYVSTMRTRAYDPLNGLIPDSEETSPRYSEKQVDAWLGWLANEMILTSRTELWLHEWICPPLTRWEVRLAISLAIGVIVAVGTSRPLAAGFAFGSLLLMGLRSSQAPTIRRRFDGKRALLRFRNWFLFGVGAGLVLGAGSGLVIGTIVATGKHALLPHLGANLAVGTVFGLLLGLPLGLGFGVASGFIDFGSDKDQLAPQLPTDVVRASAMIGVLTGSTIGLVVGGVVGALIGPLEGAVCGLAVGILSGMVFGLEFIGFHYAFRIRLARHGWGPLQWPRFLDWAAARLVLERSGAAYQWVHRDLQVHLAEAYAKQRLS